MGCAFSRPAKAKNRGGKKLELSSERSDSSKSLRSVPKTRRTTPTEKRPLISNNSSNPLKRIDQKVVALKNDVKVAETNRDERQLQALLQSVITLMTDLQKAKVNKKRKELLKEDLQRVYQEIVEIKTQVTKENDLKKSKELQKKEEKEKCLHDLEKIHHQLVEIGRSLNIQNFQKQKEMFNVLKNELNSLQDIDEEVALKKSKVSNVMLNVENVFTRVQMEEKLNRAEQSHFQYKLDLNKFFDTTESEIYKKHKLHLEQLKVYVCGIKEMTKQMDEKKKYLLYHIENNIAALDKRAKENEEMLQVQKLKLRKNDIKVGVMNLLNDIKKIQTDYTLQELQEILLKLVEAKSILEEKLSLLTNQKKPDELDNDLVSVNEKQIDSPVVATVLPSRTNFDDIRKDVEDVQIRNENLKCTKETQFYKDIKNELEGCKSKVLNSKEDGSKSRENLLKYSSDALPVLENNISNRKSTADLLADIISVRARVNEVGRKIQTSSYAILKYDSLKKKLQTDKVYLENLKINSKRSNLNKSIDDILQQNNKCLNTLESIKGSIHTIATEEEKSFNRDLRTLKAKVNRFSGRYKNVLYKFIENQLDECSKRTDTIFKDVNVAARIKQEIENMKIILEKKSSQHSDEESVNIANEQTKFCNVNSTVNASRGFEQTGSLQIDLTPDLLVISHKLTEGRIQNDAEALNIAEFMNENSSISTKVTPHDKVSDDLKLKESESSVPLLKSSIFPEEPEKRSLPNFPELHNKSEDLQKINKNNLEHRSIQKFNEIPQPLEPNSQMSDICAPLTHNDKPSDNLKFKSQELLVSPFDNVKIMENCVMVEETEPSGALMNLNNYFNTNIFDNNQQVKDQVGVSYDDSKRSEVDCQNSCNTLDLSAITDNEKNLLNDKKGDQAEMNATQEMNISVEKQKKWVSHHKQISFTNVRTSDEQKELLNSSLRQLDSKEPFQLEEHSSMITNNKFGKRITQKEGTKFSGTVNDKTSLNNYGSLDQTFFISTQTTRDGKIHSKEPKFSVPSLNTAPENTTGVLVQKPFSSQQVSHILESNEKEPTILDSKDQESSISKETAHYRNGLDNFVSQEPASFVPKQVSDSLTPKEKYPPLKPEEPTSFDETKSSRVDAFGNNDQRNENTPTAVSNVNEKQAEEIFDVHQYFCDDLDWKALSSLTDNERITTISKQAQFLKTKVEEFQEEEYSLAYFVLDEKLMRLIENLDKIKCHEDKKLRERKVKVIKNINKLHASLDKRAKENSS